VDTGGVPCGARARAMAPSPQRRPPIWSAHPSRPTWVVVVRSTASPPVLERKMSRMCTTRQRVSALLPASQQPPGGGSRRATLADERAACSSQLRQRRPRCLRRASTERSTATPAPGCAPTGRAARETMRSATGRPTCNMYRARPGSG